MNGHRIGRNHLPCMVDFLCQTCNVLVIFVNGIDRLPVLFLQDILLCSRVLQFLSQCLCRGLQLFSMFDQFFKLKVTPSQITFTDGLLSFQFLFVISQVLKLSGLSPASIILFIVHIFRLVHSFKGILLPLLSIDSLVL